MSLNVTTREFPGRSRILGGIVYHKQGYKDATLAILGVPESQLRNVMKSIAGRFPKGTMPVHRGGGPFALDDPRSRGNYIITSTPIKKDEVEQWCRHLSRFGIEQIYFHQGTPFRHADFVFNSSVYPNGISDFREVSREFNKHGIITGILTYSHFVPHTSRFVKPKPHRDLATLCTLSLAGDMDAKQTTVPITESTADISTITGFNVVNSVILRIDDELIIFHKVNKTAPFGFTECERGAYGTTPSSHKKGATVGHLAQKFGMLCSKPGSDLVREIAAETARAYNEGGFSMIYLDALDGTSSVSECREYVPYYDAFFITEILKGVKSDPVMDYCFSWYPMSRVGEWDSPRRGFQRYFDLHLETLERLAGKRYLPGHLGWMALCPSSADNKSMLQCPPMFPEDVHYLGTKTVAWDYGLSYLDVSLGRTKPLAFKNGDILKKYRLFQKTHHLKSETLKQLRSKGQHFLLTTPGDDPNQWFFREAAYENRTITIPIPKSQTNDKGKENQPVLSTSFTITNPFEVQSPILRIENRYTADEPVENQSVKLVPFDETKSPAEITTRTFEPNLDLSDKLALGLWVYGDGKDQTINVRVESPVQYVSGHNDHFIDVNFKGWRYFTLIEADNGTREPIKWAKPCGSYFDEYRELVHYDHVSEVNVMVKGDPSGLKFRTLHAIPTVTYDLINPVLSIGKNRIVFEGKIPSGNYMEYTSGNEAIVYDNIGNETGRLKVLGTLQLVSGKNSVTFQGSSNVNLPLRARLVFGMTGKKI